MKAIVIASIASFIAAFAAASWMYAEQGDADVPAAPSTGGSSFDAGLPVEERIAVLERAVNDERIARQLLQEEVFYLTSELERLSGSGNAPSSDDEAVQAEADAGADSRPSRDSRRRDSSIDERIDRLIEAGFLPSQANMIVRREAELQMDSIQARYDAERSGDFADYWRRRNETGEVLREELGDADYERYLTANNRSTSITISSVIDSSPAQSAGLQPGDEIVRYDGERVFSMSDLVNQTLQGTQGENIVVDIMRNGTPMQVVLPRGPVGISGGRWGR